MTEIRVKSTAEFNSVMSSSINATAGMTIFMDYDLDEEIESELIAEFDKERELVEAWLE